MKGTVTAKSGSTVKLRQKPSTDCPIYWDIPVGTEMQIVDRQENWTKCISGGLTGWMKNEFIRRDGTSGTVLLCSAFAEQKGPSPCSSEAMEEDEPLTLLGDVYQALKELCERIESVMGRG